MSDRTNVRRLVLAAAAVGLGSAAAPPARGGLIAGFALHENASAVISNILQSPPPANVNLDVTTLPPVDRSITAATGTAAPGSLGASVTSTYDVTDDGTTAIYNLASQGALYGSGLLTAGSAASGLNFTQFALTAPATFVATATGAGPLTTTAYANLSAVSGFDSTTVFDLGLYAPATRATGTLSAGVVYSVYDDFVMTNSGGSFPSGNGSGAFNFTLKMTAVPEPVTAGVLAVAAAAGVLGRRRRH